MVLPNSYKTHFSVICKKSKLHPKQKFRAIQIYKNLWEWVKKSINPVRDVREVRSGQAPCVPGKRNGGRSIRKQGPGACALRSAAAHPRDPTPVEMSCYPFATVLIAVWGPHWITLQPIGEFEQEGFFSSNLFYSFCCFVQFLNYMI